MLADNRADLETADNNGVTPLGVAVYMSRVDAVQLLVTHGVAVNPPPSKFGDTPVSDAKVLKHSAIVEILLGAGAESSTLVEEAALDKDDEPTMLNDDESTMLNDIDFSDIDFGDMYNDMLND